MWTNISNVSLWLNVINYGKIIQKWNKCLHAMTYDNAYQIKSVIL